ncbi:MAG: cysteine desulfurase [Bacteroidota bacterium]
MLNVKEVKEDFPIFTAAAERGQDLLYLDNAATSQKPQVVIDALQAYYQTQNANIHRGVYRLAQEATEAYEEARRKVQQFIGAKESREIVFVRGTTEAINLVAHCFAAPELKTGDNIVISAMEHHANLIPWQQLCLEKGAELRVIPLKANGELELTSVDRLLDDRSRILALVHISNSLGTINPVASVIKMAKAKGIPVLLDAAQSIAVQPIDVQALDCDFLAFSGHKLFGPTGIGVLYGRAKHLAAMRPYQFGGEMMLHVQFEETIFQDIPYKFEGGTPNIAGAIGLGIAIDYVQQLGLSAIQGHSQDLMTYAQMRLAGIEGLRLIGTASQKTAIFSFLLDDIHPHDIGTLLDESGIAIRAGHHCTQPVMQFFDIPGTARASFSIYNDRADVDRLVAAIHQVKKVFA